MSTTNDDYQLSIIPKPQGTLDLGMTTAQSILDAAGNGHVYGVVETINRETRKACLRLANGDNVFCDVSERLLSVIDGVTFHVFSELHAIAEPNEQGYEVTCFSSK